MSSIHRLQNGRQNRERQNGRDYKSPKTGNAAVLQAAPLFQICAGSRDSFIADKIALARVAARNMVQAVAEGDIQADSVAPLAW